MLGVVLAGVELAIPVLIAVVWLGGSERLSARAVRLLSLLMDKDPERYLPPIPDVRRGNGTTPPREPRFDRPLQGPDEDHPSSN